MISQMSVSSEPNPVFKNATYKPMYIPKNVPLRTSSYSTKRINPNLNVHTVTKFGLNAIDGIIEEEFYNNYSKHNVNPYALLQKNELLEWYNKTGKFTPLLQNVSQRLPTPSTSKGDSLSSIGGNILKKSGSSILSVSSMKSALVKSSSIVNKSEKKLFCSGDDSTISTSSNLTNEGTQAVLTNETLGMLDEIYMHFAGDEADLVANQIRQSFQNKTDDDSMSIYDLDSASVVHAKFEQKESKILK